MNKGAWENLKWDKKQADLRLSNMQQTLTKVGCITLQMADFMLKNAKNFEDKNEINSQILMSYDSIALLGHLIGDLSNQRRLTMKNALKPEYQTLRSSSTEIAHLPYLFGEDIGKQIKSQRPSSQLSIKGKNNILNQTFWVQTLILAMVTAPGMIFYGRAIDTHL